MNYRFEIPLFENMEIVMMMTQERSAVATVANPAPQEKPTLDEVCDRIQADDNGKWDTILSKNELVMQGGKLKLPDGYESHVCDSLAPTPWATGQLCGRLGIPTAYFRRCPIRLQDTQFNFWSCYNGESDEHFHAGDSLPPASRYPEEDGYSYEDDYVESEPTAYRNGHSIGNGFYNRGSAGSTASEYWRLRARGESLRAVLTERYSPLDNRALLESLRKSLPPHLQVQWVELDDESFHLRLFDPNLRRHVRSNDPLQAGLHIANSEVGKRSVTVDAVVYREVCTNGLVRLVKGKSILQQRHIGVAPAHFKVLLRQAMQQSLLAAQEFMAQMAATADQPLQDVDKELKQLVTHWKLSQNFVEQVQASLQQEDPHYQETVFGLVNAVTHAAQTLDADRRFEMEIVAGKLLERRSMRSTAMPQTRKVVTLAPVPKETSPLQMARDTFDATPVEEVETVDSEAVAA